MQQYPHTVVVKKSNWNEGSNSTYTKKGRAETGANAKKGFNHDEYMNLQTVIAIVYMPLPVDTIEIGIPVEVYANDELIVSGAVKQFSKGQLNARIWL